MFRGEDTSKLPASELNRQGMSLVEILVVLVIVGIASGAVVLGLGGVDRETTVQIEANRFAERLRLASDDVLVAGRPLSVVWTPTSYGFEGVGNPNEALVQSHALPAGVLMSAPGGVGSAVIDPDSAGPAVDFTFRKGSVAWSVRYDGLNAETSAVSESGSQG